MKLSLCNEVIRDMPFADQCDFTARLGYDGLEIAPFTLVDDPRDIDKILVRQLRKSMSDAGLVASSLHWLLLAPKGMSISDPDPGVARKTQDVIARLCDLAAELDAPVLVHGSPLQRQIDGDSGRLVHAEKMLSFAAAQAEQAGVTYCIEPLGRNQTDFINTQAEAAELVARIGRASFATMLDCSAAAHSETESLASLTRAGLQSGMIRHVQVNDLNLRGPGQGDTPIGPVLQVLVDEKYKGWVAVEPFDYEPDGRSCAARAIGYLRGMLEMIT